jgi:hypothetical protein
LNIEHEQKPACAARLASALPCLEFNVMSRHRKRGARRQSVAPVRIDLITEETTRAILGGERPISKPTLYRGIREGRFPRGVRVTDNCVRYNRAEVEGVVRSLFATRG